MNLQNEIEKIQLALQIPITNLIFNDKGVEIISGTKNIGAIPYYNVAGILTYDNAKESVNWLNWVDVYDQNKNEIDNLIIGLAETNEIILSNSTFRRLYVKDKSDKLLMTVICSYTNNEWKVMKE